MRIAECNARTPEDVRLYAEKAAHEGLKLKPFFNSLQVRTENTLSPETRIFAEVCYEKNLSEYVAIALIECANSDRGRVKAMEIFNSFESCNIRDKWKPLIDHCSQLLRSIKLEATNARLSRLNDLWSPTENGEKAVQGIKQSERLWNVVRHAISKDIDQANRCRKQIMEWIELYSIPHSSAEDTIRYFIDDQLQRYPRNLVVVSESNAFAEAQGYLEQKVRKQDAIIHVIVGNEDDGARLYKKIFERFTVGIQLFWKKKEYGVYGIHQTPMIVIGSTEYFASKYSESGMQKSAQSFVRCFFCIQPNIFRSSRVALSNAHLVSKHCRKMIKNI